jgi:MFS family permease
MSALAPFRIRSFRFQWPADLLTSWAFEMETLVLGWYILVETGSVLLLTLFGALQFGGTLIAPMFGVASDRIGHRNLLSGMRAVYALVAAALMICAFAGLLHPLLALILAALTGLVRPSDMGLRGALIAETMPFDRLTSAMSISRTTSDTARIAAAAVIVGSFSPWLELREGIVHVWNTPSLLALVYFAFLFNLTAFPITNGLLPYVAREIYHVDQTGLGYLVASLSFGALIGSLVLTRSGLAAQLPRLMIVSAVVWQVLLLGFAQMPSMFGGLVFLTLAGVTQSLVMVSHAVILLRASGHHLRGRIMGVRILAVYGLPLGLLVAGALIERAGFRATATIYAVIGIVSTVLVAARWGALLWKGQPFDHGSS